MVASVKAAKFLHMQHIYRIYDLPYQSQIVPLAAILVDIGDAWEHEANRAKLVRWYNVKALTGKPRSRGRFKVAWGQDLAREYLPLVSGSPRKDGIALSKLKPLLLDAEIETVTCDRRQRALDPVLHYSVIRSIRLSRDVAQPI